MLIALVLVVVCAGPSVCKLPIVDLRRFPRLLDFLVASARSFHSFYSASRFSYPASLAVGRRVVVTAASRPNVTSMPIAMQACRRWSANEARGDRGVCSAIGRCIRLASRRAIRPAVFACCRSQFAGENSHGSCVYMYMPVIKIDEQRLGSPPPQPASCARRKLVAAKKDGKVLKELQ